MPDFIVLVGVGVIRYSQPEKNILFYFALEALGHGACVSDVSESASHLLVNCYKSVCLRSETWGLKIEAPVAIRKETHRLGVC